MGVERRGQEHAGEDHHRRVPGRRRTDLRQGARQSFRSPAEARSAGIVSVYQDPALVPDLTVARTCGWPAPPNDAVRKWLGELGVAGLDFGELIRDLPYPTAAADRSRPVRSPRSRRSCCSTRSRLRFPRTCPSGSTRWSGAGARRGNAVIFISHRMAEISALCDRTTVLRDGVTVGVTERARGHEERIVALMLGEAAAAAPAAAPSRAHETGGRRLAPSRRSRCAG